MATTKGEEVPVVIFHTPGISAVLTGVLGALNIFTVIGTIGVVYLIHQIAQDALNGNNNNNNPPPPPQNGGSRAHELPQTGGENSGVPNTSTSPTDSKRSSPDGAQTSTNKEIRNSNRRKTRYGLPTSFAYASPRLAIANDVVKSNFYPSKHDFPSISRASTKEHNLGSVKANFESFLPATFTHAGSNASTKLVAPQMYEALVGVKDAFSEHERKYSRSYGRENQSRDTRQSSIDSRSRLYSLIEPSRTPQNQSSSGRQTSQRGGYNNLRTEIPSNRHTSGNSCLGVPHFTDRSTLNENYSREFLGQYNKPLWKNNYS